ncbi:MAG: endonuclease/exonuclease/phosphatase family protein [Bacteroidales bacterium]|nr:endonuclease/exonuclease/phosphatase family protein [Bacteroidales bacterium]
MNAKLLYLLAALPVLLPSCNKEQAKQPFRLQAGVEQTAVKTVMGDKSESQYPIYWSEGDVIAVNGSLSQPLAAGDAGTSSATFTFDEKPATAGVYNVVYPGTATSGRVVFPASQSYVENSFCPGAAPLIGQTDNLDAPVTMRSCAAVIRFSIKGNVKLTSMEVSTPAGEKISGNFDMNLVPQDGASAKMNYSFGSGLELSETAKTVVFTVPAGSYQKGIRAVLKASGGSSMTLSFFTNGATVEAKVCAFPSITFQAGKEIIFTETDPMGGEEIDIEETAGAEGMNADDAALATAISVGSYNIWAPSARKSVMDDDATVPVQRSWANSYTAVADMIKLLDCDVIGLQEVTRMVYKTTYQGTSDNKDYDGNVHTLNSLLPSYSWVIYNANNTTYDSSFPNNTTAAGLGSTDAILYKSSVLTLNAKGRAWLNGSKTEHPETGKNWDGIGTNRPATWARFTHKASGKQFVFITTHLDLPNAGEESDPAFPQRRNATELIEWFAPTYAGDLPSVITGDMNVDAGDTAGNYDILVSGKWKDSYDIMKEWGTLSYIDQRVKGTMPANKNEEGGLSSWRPDHVLFYGFTLSFYMVGREKLPTANGEQHWPSDHLPVKVVLNF